MSTFTHITNIDLITDTTQISQILYDNIPVAWIEYDSFKRIIVHYKDEWYYIDGNNLTIRTIIYTLGYKRPIVTWTERGERYDVLDELVTEAPKNTIHIFTNPNDYLDYSEYDNVELYDWENKKNY